MRLLLLGFISIFLLACASGRKSESEKPARAETAAYDESFDPMSLNDDDINIEAPADAKEKTFKTPAKEAETSLVQRERQGYRVQILATKNIEAATRIEQEAKEVFGMHDHKVYLVFEPPLYKVRIGDVTERPEADGIRNMARDFGYREAFVVRSKVNVSEQP